MARGDLHAVLRSMVEQHGFKTVSHVLHEMEARDPGPNSGDKAQAQRQRKNGRRVKRRLSAVDFVQSMEVPAERAAVVRRAAEEFEQRVFLPTLNDLRSFCEAYGIDEPRSRSRASGIPRIFKFLVTMAVADVEKMLDDRVFSGPAELGPIADAIRDKAKEYREATLDRT